MSVTLFSDSAAFIISLFLPPYGMSVALVSYRIHNIVFLLMAHRCTCYRIHITTINMMARLLHML